MGRDLFAENSDSEEGNTELKTNKEYAKSYNKFRQKELLKKLKDREKELSGSSSSSSDSESSEDEAVNPKFDEEFLCALASLKRKDPKIYDKETNFFKNIKESSGGKKKKSEKSFTIKDYERKVILEHGGVYEEEEDENDVSPKIQRPASPTYVEEQKLLKEEIKKVLSDSEISEEEEFGGIFRRREKPEKEKNKEEQQYLKWLAGQEADIGQASKNLKPLKDYWSNPTLPKREQFLRDYILNNGYIGADTDEIPTYDEIVNDDGKNLSEDEKELEKQAEFEHKYNFRFEEPDQEFIKRYPRTIETSVRKTDDRRKLKRQEVKERKLREKEQKYQELQALKALKRKEIEEKIQKLKEVTGNDELAFNDMDIEEDFDPDAHDKRMKEIFDDTYYEKNEDEEKPECPDIEDLKVEDWDNYDPKNDNDECVDNYDYEPHCEDEDFNMDCDYDPNAKVTLQNELIENTKKGRNRRRRKNQFMEMIKKDKPAFNPEDEKTYAEYIEEYYKMDYEDMIGDIPCRFKYVETVPNDFGLTIEEILLAKNKELNQWASLKKAVQMRPEHVERNEVKMYKLKAQNEALKRKIFVSLYGPTSDDDEKDDEGQIKPSLPDEPNKEAKKKNKKKRRSTGSETVVVKAKCSKVSTSKADHEGNILNDSVQKQNKDEVKIDVCVDSGKETQTEKSIKKYQNRNLANESKKTKKSNGDVTKLRTKQKNKVFKNKINKEKNLKEGKKRNMKFKKKNIPNEGIVNKLSDERLKAYGINAKKFRKKQKYAKNKDSVK